jgi:hypothetical protein
MEKGVVIKGSLKLKKAPIRKLIKKPMKEAPLTGTLYYTNDLPTLSEVRDNRTRAEKNFDEMMIKRENERYSKYYEHGHKEKINKFNDLLDKLPEHFDIPRVGPE